MQSHSLARAAAFSCGVIVWAWWWLTVDSGLPVHIPVLRWAAALFLFGAAFFTPWRRPSPDLLTAAVAVLIGAAMLPRALGLDLSPYEVTLDEAIHPLLGREVLQNEPWRIFDGVSGHFATPYLDLVLQGVLPGLQGARLMSAILSGISLLTTYALASRLYDRRTGAFATIVLACAYWHVAYARTGYPFMQAILIVTLAPWILVRGLEEENSFLLFVGGIFLGVSGLLYTSGRIVVPVFALWWLLGALAGRFRWRTLLPTALGLVVFLSPYVQRHTFEIFLARYRGAAGNELAPLAVLQSHGWLSDEGLHALTTQTKAAWRVYVDTGAWMAPHSFAPGPLVDSVSLSLALGGLVLCLWWWRRVSSILLLLWVGATFIGAQVLTDVPHSAYRAAPLLPALAITAGVAIEWCAAMISRLFGWEGNRLRVFLALAVLAYLAPVNRALIETFLEHRTEDPGAAMARLVAAGNQALTYFLVSTEPIVADPRFQLIAGDKDARDATSLADLLGANLSDSVGKRGAAVFVLSPKLRTAESAIRRCYPGAVPLAWPQWKGLNPAVGLWLRPEAIASGRDCELRSTDERGLRAAYFERDDFQGDVVRARLEDWPVRWVDGGASKDYGSIEWRGFLNVPVAGVYRLNLASTSEGSTAAIGDRILLKAGQVSTAALAARIYKVTLRFRASPSASYALLWEPPGGRIEAIPPEVFSPYPRNRSDLRWVD